MFIQYISLVIYTSSLFVVSFPQTVNEKLYQFIVSETEVKTMFHDNKNQVIEDSTKMEFVVFSAKVDHSTIYSDSLNIYFMDLDKLFFDGILYFLVFDEIKETKNKFYVTVYFTNDLDIPTHKIPQYAIHLTIKKKKTGYKLEDQMIEKLSEPLDLKKYID
jgi:hypothetical protein